MMHRCLQTAGRGVILRDFEPRVGTPGVAEVGVGESWPHLRAVACVESVTNIHASVGYWGQHT